MKKHLAIPDLMTIDSRRESGESAPPMRQDFKLLGVMGIQHPNADPASGDAQEAQSQWPGDGVLMPPNVLGVPDLMTIDSRRQAGEAVPPMRQNFMVRGLMGMQSPNSNPSEATQPGLNKWTSGNLILSIGGLMLVSAPAEV